MVLKQIKKVHRLKSEGLSLYIQSIFYEIKIRRVFNLFKRIDKIDMLKQIILFFRCIVVGIETIFFVFVVMSEKEIIFVN